MALNKFMHPRNIYRNRKANFQHLAIKYPEFRKHVFPDVSGKLFLDFKNPDSLRQLSITLMKHDFGLDVELPPDRLVPTIPLRLNYILWVEDILKGSNVEHEIKGIDIGTGGSCVYPLLSTCMYRWKFLATEVDDLNFNYAVKNIKKNNMFDYIHVEKVDESAILLAVLKDNGESYDFCMCNPPFFSDHLEAQGITNSRSDDRPEPHSVNTAGSTESVAFGGEVEFVKRMIHESIELKDKVRVYTSMVGKKKSLPPLKEVLRNLKVTNFSTTEFCQGKTMRWGIGWSFDESVKFPKSEFKEKKKEKRSPLSYLVPEDVHDLMYTIEGVAYQIKEYFKELQINCEEKSASETKINMVITAQQNTWSNQRRKRRQWKNENKQNKFINKDDENKNKYKMSECENETTAHTDLVDCCLKTHKRKRTHSEDSDESDQKNPEKLLKLDEESKNPISSKGDNTDLPFIEHKTESASDGLSTNQNLETIDQSTSSNVMSNTHNSTASDVTENCEQQITKTDDCLLKCNLLIKQVEDEQVMIEMSWINGTVHESMNQVLQYLKKQTKIF